MYETIIKFLKNDSIDYSNLTKYRFKVVGLNCYWSRQVYWLGTGLAASVSHPNNAPK
ncbi:MAG: hypothetical protein WA364_20125 [Candidatus Nitrosopolaris sp.]